MTLIELVIYMAIAAVLAAIASLAYTPNATKARYQAERVRTDLRYAQMLALTQGTPMRLTATAGAGGSYAVSRIDGVGTGACTTSAMTDPATGSAFSVTLDSALTLGGTGTLDLDALGRPASCAGNPCTCTVTTSGTDPAASYTVAGGGTTYTVAVRPTTGFATVTP